MSRFKRKGEDDLEELEKRSLKKPAFFLEEADITENISFDREQPPCSAEQYLRMVRAQAASIPDVVVARTPASSASISLSAEESEQSADSLHSFAVGPEYSYTSSQRYIILKRFVTMKQTILSWRMKTTVRSDTGYFSPSDIARWHDHLYGMNASLPSIPYIAHLSHACVLGLLSHHTTWISRISELSREQGLWVYALLARLDTLLTSEEIHKIRELGKQLIRVRWIQAGLKVDRDHPTISFVNIVLCILAEVYGQKDLK